MCVHVTKLAEMMALYKEGTAVVPILSMWGAQWTHPNLSHMIVHYGFMNYLSVS